jgi:hypothetical protein
MIAIADFYRPFQSRIVLSVIDLQPTDINIWGSALCLYTRT